MKKTELNDFLNETLAEAGIVDNGDIDLASFEIQSDLNSVFWDKSNGYRLFPEIRSQLLKIAKDFAMTLDIGEIFGSEDSTIKILKRILKDVVFVGSLASYNYSEYSDVDLHLIVDLSVLNLSDVEKAVFGKYFQQCRKDWNSQHKDLKIKGFDVELYVQDISEKNAANGIYSLLKDSWIKFPSKMVSSFDRRRVTEVASDYIGKIDNLERYVNEDPSPEILDKIIGYSQKLKDKIVLNRRDSLNGKTSDEMSNDNIVFKVLRRSGYLEKLNDIIVKAYDLKNSLSENYDLL